ncbi:hypothetical protein GR925_29095 [Streptomyces sp. HUCO-GS316]|nr:hypothetical protein [Streptomyces sp. HUCO-GS316]
MRAAASSPPTATDGSRAEGDGAVRRGRPGPWSVDLDAAFYVALYLRAAQFVLRRGCPVVCS